MYHLQVRNLASELDTDTRVLGLPFCQQFVRLEGVVPQTVTQ